MPLSSNGIVNKAVMLLAIRDYLCRHPATTRQIAEEFGISQRDVQRYLGDLQGAPLYTPLWQDEMGRWRWIVNELTVADMLVYGLGLKRPESPPLRATPPGTRCVITGVPIAEGYRVSDLATKATTEFLDLFRGHPDGWVSENVGRCFKAHRETARCCLIFEDATHYDPLISRESAKGQGRPCWSDLVRAVWPERIGQRVLCILTTNMKRRLWPRARVGALGARTPIYILDADLNLDGCYIVNWPRMIERLNFIEMLYSAGFSKRQIQFGLLQAQIAYEIGIQKVLSWEGILAHIRQEIEFLMALLIAQRKEEIA